MGFSVLGSWNSFFFRRTGVEGCRIAGYVRIAFAFLFLVDRILLMCHLDHFFSPDHGLMPYRVTRIPIEQSTGATWTIFRYAPESESLVWIVAGLGLLHGIILLLGTTQYPRWNLFFLYLNIQSFTNHNFLIWTGEEDMFRMWCFLLLFFPLDVCTVRDGFGFQIKEPSKGISWPMWPFRIFQIEMSIIYMGASLGKLYEPHWQDGSSIYRITYGNHDYPGVFNPDFLFQRYGPLRLLCWASLILEGICYISVWFPDLRECSVLLMIFLHVGIDLSMQMHMFEWLSIVGWCVFLIQPPPTIDDGKAAEVAGDASQDGLVSEKERETAKTVGKKGLLMKFVTSVFVVFLVSILALDAVPFRYFHQLLPKSAHRTMQKITKKRSEIFLEYISPIVNCLGIRQNGDWSMYTDVQATITTYRIDAKLDDGTEQTIWESPNWSTFSNLEKKYYTRHINYFGELRDYRDAVLHLVKAKTTPLLGPLLEQENALKAIEFVMTDTNHRKHTMASTGGFWDPVYRYPMNRVEEEMLMSVVVETCNDSSDCENGFRFEISTWVEPEEDEDDDDLFGVGEYDEDGTDEL